MLIRRRGAGDIWQGLYELPLIETGEVGITVEELTAHPAFCELLSTLERPTFHPTPIATHAHRLSHRQIQATLFLLEAEGVRSTSPYLTIPTEERTAYAFPVLIERLLAKAK